MLAIHGDACTPTQVAAPCNHRSRAGRMASPSRAPHRQTARPSQAHLTGGTGAQPKPGKARPEGRAHEGWGWAARLVIGDVVPWWEEASASSADSPVPGPSLPLPLPLAPRMAKAAGPAAPTGYSVSLGSGDDGNKIPAGQGALPVLPPLVLTMVFGTMPLCHYARDTINSLLVASTMHFLLVLTMIVLGVADCSVPRCSFCEGERAQPYLIVSITVSESLHCCKLQY
jgi:hypothetical protein